MQNIPYTHFRCDVGTSSKIVRQNRRLRRSHVNIPLSFVLPVSFCAFLRRSFLCVSCWRKLFCSLFVARYHLDCFALLHDCYSKVGWLWVTIFRLCKVLGTPQIFSRARS